MADRCTSKTFIALVNLPYLEESAGSGKTPKSGKIITIHDIASLPAGTTYGAARADEMACHGRLKQQRAIQSINKA